MKNRLNIGKEKEKEVPILELYLYPCRGMTGIKMDELQLGEHGIRYDRIFVVIDAQTRKPVHTANAPDITGLSQRIEGEFLVISTKNQDRVKGDVRISMKKSFDQDRFE